MNNVRSVRQPKQAQPKLGKKLNLLEKLHLFQINGSIQEKRSTNIRVFEYFPRRLVFRLCDLIKSEDWKHNLTFLGFTQDGQFLLSYTVQYGYNDNPLIPNRHIYHMQWWLFVPYRSLEMVREIRLFKDQEITEDILLAVCQWPSDNAKLLVYGSYRRSNDPENGRWSYLTITAMPPLKSCTSCSALSSKENEDESEEIENDEYCEHDLRKLCLQHSFSVHTRYIRVPPFPAFNPYINMKVDGLVIINTGDNLIALSVDIQAATPTTLNNLAQNVNPPVPQLQPLSIFCDDELVALNDFLSPCHCLVSSPDDWSQNYLSDPKHGGTNLCIECCKPVGWRGRASKIDDMKNLSEFSALSKRGSISVGDECFEVVKNVTYHTDDNKEKNGDVKCLTIQLDNAWQTDEVPDIPLDEATLKETPLMQHGYYRHCEKENISPKSARIVSSPKLASPKERKASEERVSEGALAMPSVTGSQSSGCNDGENGNSNGAHKSGSCVAEKVQYFGQWEENESNPSHFEDESAGTEYHNVLSFEVSGVQCKPMKALNPDRLQNWLNSAVAVHHLTFDIEQFAHEMAQKICNEAGKKYLAFLDYDVQIIDVCEVSQMAIALVLMQVQAMVGQKGVAKELRSSVRKVFQTGFKFEWDIKTGSYSIIDTEELHEVHPNPGSLNNGRFWNPASLMVSSLRKDFFIPLSSAKSVRVMTNSNMPSGESLKVLWAPAHDVAIVL